MQQNEKDRNNQKKCVCRFKNCVRHGKCEECLRHHRAMGEMTACQKKKA